MLAARVSLPPRPSSSRRRPQQADPWGDCSLFNTPCKFQIPFVGQRTHESAEPTSTIHYLWVPLNPLEAAYPSKMRTLRSHGQPAASAQTSIARRLIRKRPLAARPSEEPRQSYPPDKPPEPEALCPICLCELSGSDFGTTQCGHSFHTECLSIWMIHDRRHTCPECRAHVGASASRSRMFAATGEAHNLSVRRPARMPRFHGG